MSDVRKLLARLNPASMQYDGARGGFGGMTAQDIAGALGMVPYGLGREVMCAVWWPDGARLTHDKLDFAVAQQVRAEMDRRARRQQIARLDLHIAQENAAARNATTDEDRREIARLEKRAAEARALCWPYEAEMHVRIRRAALDEITRPNHCRACGGHGESTIGALKVGCKACDSHGTVPVSDRARAEKIGRDESNYRRAWRGLYEYVYQLMHEAEAEACRQLRDALRDAPTKAA